MGKNKHLGNDLRFWNPKQYLGKGVYTEQCILNRQHRLFGSLQIEIASIQRQLVCLLDKSIMTDVLCFGVD